jgi:hypothetical protein
VRVRVPPRASPHHQLDFHLTGRSHIGSPLEGSPVMLANSVGLVVLYLAFGLLISFLARKGRSEDWDESLLASLLGPPLFTLIAAAVAVRFLWTHLGPRSPGSRDQTAW